MLLSLAEYEQANFSHTFFQELMPTFTEFVETKPAKDEQVADVLRYTLMLAEALSGDAPREEYSFDVDTSGKKYHRIWMHIGERRDSIHCFIDKNSGAVYKSASVKAPAKGVRYNLLDSNSREECYARCDWAGGYLYMR